MKVPRVSVSTLMAAVILVAINCMIVRAFATRPNYLMDGIDETAISLLPMVNILAIALSFAIRRRFQFGPFLIGFLSFGVLAVISTFFRSDWRKELLFELPAVWWQTWLDNLTPSQYDVFEYAGVPGLRLLFQLVIAGLGGLIAQVSCSRFRGVWRPKPVSKALHGCAFFGILTVIGMSYVVVEGVLRWKVDPQIPYRLPTGGIGTLVTQTDLLGLVRGFAMPTAELPPTGTRLRVQQDQNPHHGVDVLARYGQSSAFERLHYEMRLVNVQWLESGFKGKTASVPFCCIRQDSDR